MKFKKDSTVLIGIYALVSVLWIIFYFGTDRLGTYEGFFYQYLLIPFSIGMMILPLIGGFRGLLKAKIWGGWQSAMGKSLIGLSLGLISWSIGMIVWNYFLIFTDIKVPYPSLADLFFGLSYPLWAFGIIQLSRVTGAKFGLKNSKKSSIAGVALMCVFFTYYSLFSVARGGTFAWTGTSSPFKLFFDLYYPIADIVILTMAILLSLLSKRYLGGKFKLPVILLFAGFGMSFLADFVFSYTTNLETYFDGHLVDMLFLSTMFLLSYAISLMDTESLQDK